MTEEWRLVPGWEHRYEVSDLGRVRSCDMVVGCRNGTAIRRGRLLVQIPKQGRYLAVTFADKNRREQWLIHDIVAAAFIGPKPPKMHVLHRDDDKYNNALCNLRYGTPKENEADKRANGKALIGERHHAATISDDIAAQIYQHVGTSRQIAEKFGVTKCVVDQVRCGRTWRHATKGLDRPNQSVR